MVEKQFAHFKGNPKEVVIHKKIHKIVLGRKENFQKMANLKNNNRTSQLQFVRTYVHEKIVFEVDAVFVHRAQVMALAFWSWFFIHYL